MAASAAETRKSKMKSASYGDTVIETFKELKQNDELCDFTVSAEGKSIKVHKILLAATSDYFRVMLQGPMREPQEHFVDLKSLTSDALQQIIDFMYSGEMTFNFDNLIEILNAANHLQVKTALDLCSDYMISMLTFSNADEILHIADTYSLDRVKQFYTNKVLTNFDEFSRTEQFLQLPAKQLARYLADDNIVLKSEALLYDIVAKWYGHDQSRSEQIDELLNCIRFSLMSETQLSNLQQHHWLTKQHPACLKFIKDGMAYHSASNRGHPIIDKNSKIRATSPSLTLVHQGSSYRPFEICAFNGKDSKFYQLCNDNQSARDCRVTTVDNFIYICRVVDCGGGTLLNSMIRFDPRHTKIDELNACRLLRIDPALVSRGQWLYMFGGSTDPFAVLDEVECYDVRTNTWMNLLPLPQPIHSHSATVYKDVIYVCGGMDINRQPLASLHVYDPTSQQWESKSPMQVARRLHVMLTLGELVYVVGGIGSHSFHQQTQIPIESYNPATDQWTVYSSTLAGRSIGHFLTLNDKIVSIGREHYEATEDDIWEYDTKNDTWKSMVKVPRQMGLQTASGVLLHINFSDEKVAKKVLTDRR